MKANMAILDRIVRAVLVLGISTKKKVAQ